MKIKNLFIILMCFSLNNYLSIRNSKFVFGGNWRASIKFN